MIYNVRAQVVEARGSLVSKYAGASGTAEIEVVSADGAFVHGQPNAEITVNLKNMNLHDAKGKLIDLSNYSGDVIGQAQTVTLTGYRYEQQIQQKPATATISIAFAAPMADTAPAQVIGTVAVVGRGLALLAFKSLRIELQGTLQG